MDVAVVAAVAVVAVVAVEALLAVITLLVYEKRGLSGGNTRSTRKSGSRRIDCSYCICFGGFYNRRGAVTVVDTRSGKAEVVKPVSSGDAFIFVSAEYTHFHHLCYKHHHRSLTRSSTPYSILTLCMYQTTPDHITSLSF